MIYTLASIVKEAADELLDKRVKEKKNKIHAVKEAEFEKEMEKFRGELVTKERYEVWRKKLEQEREEVRRKEREREEEENKKRGAPVVKEKKLTGRQLFERGMAKAGEDQEDEEE
jgi:hypothetical protein